MKKKINIIKKILDKWKKDPVVKFGLYASVIIVAVYFILFIYSHLLLIPYTSEGNFKNLTGNSAYIVDQVLQNFYREIFCFFILINTFTFIRKRKDANWISFILSLLIMIITYLTMILSMLYIEKISDYIVSII